MNRAITFAAATAAASIAVSAACFAAMSPTIGFNVTPDIVRVFQAQGAALPSADQLVRLRLAGIGPRRRRQ